MSDISRNRRIWIWLGLALSTVLLLAVERASGLASLIALVVVWQLALNMMLAPLSAWAGDCVPDSQKGILGGLLAFAPGIGALGGAFVTIPEMASADARLALVALIVACCVLPVLVAGRPLKIGEPSQSPAEQTDESVQDQQLARSKAVRRMWFARLAVQVAEAALFSYLFFWFRSIDPAMGDNRTARIFSVVLVVSAPSALLAGRWADRRNRPVTPLVVCALVSAVALVGMALSRTLPLAIATYALFGFATSIFLALHSAQTLRVLPRSDRRGRDLGLFNLTNTVPSLVMPWFTLALVPYFGFSGLFLLLSGLALISSLLLWPLGKRI